MMDWLTPSLDSAGMVLTYMYNLCLSVLYVAAIPLYYPIYYFVAFIAFLLSPFWYMFSTFSSATMFIISFIARLKYLYIYFACAAIIGFCAAAMLHGTSSMLFLLLGMHPSQQPKEASPLAVPRTSSEDPSEAESFGFTWSGGESSSRISSESLSMRRKKERFGGKDALRRFENSELYENQWNLLSRSALSPQPRRKTKGLLAQTIHEESSESDSL